MSGATGPTGWQSPAYFPQAPSAPISCVVNGVALDIVPADFTHALLEEAGTFVATMGGGGERHSLVQSPVAPLSMQLYEYEISWAQVSAEQRTFLGRIPALASRENFRVWFPVPFLELWVADGTATTYGLSRSTAYAAIPYDDYPPRFAVRQAGQPEAVLDAVELTPTAGQVQISKTTDSVSVTFGDTWPAGTELLMEYQPYIRGAVSTSGSVAGKAGTFELTITEALPPRVF